MTVRHHNGRNYTHADACTDGAHTIASGYATYRNATRYTDTHLAPTGHAYVVVPTPGTPAWAETYDVVCTPLASGYDHDGRIHASRYDGIPHPAPMYGTETPNVTRYGVAITTVDPARSYVGTADGMGYAAPSPTATPSVGGPTVPATTATPVDTIDTDASDAHYAATHRHARGLDRDRTAEFAASRARYANTPDVPARADIDTASLFDDPAPSAPLTESTMCGRFATARAANTWIHTYAGYVTPRATPGGTPYTVPTDAWGNTYGYDTDGVTYTVWASPADGDGYIDGNTYVTYPPNGGNESWTYTDTADDHTPALPPNATTVDGRTVVAARNAVHTADVGAPTPHGVTPHTGTHAEIGYTGHVCTVAAGATITYTYTADADRLGNTYDRTIIGTVGRPVGMASLGNAGYTITDTGGGVTHISRLAVVTIIAPDTYADDVVGLVAPHAPNDTYTYVPATVIESRGGSRIIGAYRDGHTGHMAVVTDTGVTYADTPPVTPWSGSIMGSRHIYPDGTMRVYGPTGTVTYNTLDRTYARNGAPVSSLAWVTAGGESCGHDVGGYGACIAPLNHPLHNHVDAHGHRFAGTRLTPYATPIGCDTPATMTRVVCRMPFQRDTYRTTLTVDAAMMAHTYNATHAVLGDGTYRVMMRAYRDLVTDACGDMALCDLYADDIYDAFITDVTTPATYTSPARIPYTA